MTTSRYLHVLWDWNGTLLDDLDLCVDVINGVLARRGMPPIDSERYLALFDFPVRRFYERLGFELAGDTFERLSFEFISTYDARRLETRLHAGVPELLGAVAGSGRAQSILSAHRESTLLGIVEHFGIHAHFSQIAGLDDIHAHSKVERGRTLCASLGHAPDEMILVGDTLHDLEVARALGIDCALVARGHHPAPKLRRDHELVFDDLAQLRAYLCL